MTPRWSLSLLTTFGHTGTQAGLKGVSWGSQPQDVLHVFLPFMVVLVPKLTLNGVNWELRDQAGFN